MLSTSATTSSRQDQGYGKSYTPQIPKGFTVRVFKGSSIYSQPQTTAAAFDRGYQSIPLTGPRQSTDSRNWHQPQNTPSKTTSAPSEPPSASHSQINPENRLVRYDSNSRPSAGYSIYQGSKDTYVYEASVSSSKGDAYSNSEDDATTAEYTPSSAFSPALSTDSIMTLRGAMTPDVSTAELSRLAPAPTPTRTSSFIPSLSQAQTAIKGFFRSQTPNISQPPAGSSYTPRSANARPTSSIGLTSPTRSGTPFASSEASSASRQRGADGITSAARIPPQNQNARPEPSQPRITPVLDAEDSDSESDTERDSIARANAEYNATASRQGSPTRTYYSSVRDSIHFPAMTGTAGDAARQLFPNLPLRSSPEQYHAQATTPHSGENSSYYRSVEMTKPQVRAVSDSEDTVRSGHSSLRSRGWSASEERRHPATRPLPVPPVQQPAPPSATQMSRSQSTGPAPNRYVPASRTMTSPEPTSTLEQAVSISAAPSGTYPQRERRASEMSRISPVLPPSQASTPHEVGGAGAVRSGPQGHEARRDATNIQGSYAPHRHEPPPATQEHYSLGTSSPHEFNNTSSNRHALAESSRETPASRYVGSNDTQPINSASTQPSTLQTPAEQMYYTSSQQHLQQVRGSAPPPVATNMASSYASSAHCTTRVSNSPPRVRHDSLASQTSARRLTSIYAPPNVTPYTTHQRGGEYGSRPEAERQTNGKFSNPYPRSANEPPGHSVSDTEGYAQRSDVLNASSRRSNVGHPSYVQAPSSTVASDPGPVLDHRRDSTSQYAWPGQGRHAISTSSSARHHEGLSSHNTSGPIHSQMDLPAPRRDPERRYSESDGPIASNSTYAPAYASYAPTAPDSRSAIPIEHQLPQRRYSDGDQINPSNVQDRTSLTLFRTVRWNENLVCPSPIFSHQRRKGWFNRRGDQLWTNDGAYKPSPAGQEYPADLNGYPEQGEGWMNEQGVRIDMSHRLIPKAPLKSAMKSSRTQPILPLTN